MGFRNLLIAIAIISSVVSLVEVDRTTLWRDKITAGEVNEGQEASTGENIKQMKKYRNMYQS